jgi:hypothetical protein|tara:strand:- start:436 stop:714 length:279 start_codon:yes stop_codon:yes gene_type:complete
MQKRPVNKLIKILEKQRDSIYDITDEFSNVRFQTEDYIFERSETWPESKNGSAFVDRFEDFIDLEDEFQELIQQLEYDLNHIIDSLEQLNER